MKAGRYIPYIIFPVLVALIGLLCWNCTRIYSFENGNIQKKVEATISDVANKVQWYNGSQLSNYTAMLTDKNFDAKVAFAAGFTHNKGKFSKLFFDDDTPSRAPGSDTNIISAKLLKANNIRFTPASLMTIAQFDSLFRIGLKDNRLGISYNIQKVGVGDTIVSKDTIVSSPFIIDFFTPRMYDVKYRIPAILVLGNMAPYMLSNVFLCVLLIFSALFFNRSYRIKLQAYEFRENLFGNIAHELKTPITSIQLIVNDAKKNISDGDIATISPRHILFAENELDRMKVIVDRILSFNKMSHDHFAFKKERVDLNELIVTAIRTMEINVRQAQGIIRYEPGNNIIVAGDPALLLNVISAIIDNALKYTHKPPEINISLAIDGKDAVIKIRDNGIGIDKRMSKKIFEPFFRVPTGNVYNTSGHGLGLSFAKQLMKLHQGVISFGSDESGTTFYLKFKVF